MRAGSITEFTSRKFAKRPVIEVIGKWLFGNEVLPSIRTTDLYDTDEAEVKS